MCAGGPGRIPRPRWGLLYTLVILSLAGLGVEQVIVSPDALRTVVGATLALVVFATMALWVRMNRVALEQQEACDCRAVEGVGDVDVLLLERAGSSDCSASRA